MNKYGLIYHALQGHNNIAQGLAPVCTETNKSPLSGAHNFPPPRGPSFPRETLIQTDTVQLANPTKLVLERYLLVMFLLPLNIRHHRIHMTVAHAERTIPLLPEKMMVQTTVLLVNPSRRARFNRPHDFRYIRLFPQHEQNVDVVRRAPHLNGRTSVVVEYLRHIGMHLRQMLFGYGVRPPLGREHQMYVNFR